MCIQCLCHFSPLPPKGFNFNSVQQVHSVNHTLPKAKGEPMSDSKSRLCKVGSWSLGPRHSPQSPRFLWISSPTSFSSFYMFPHDPFSCISVKSCQLTNLDFTNSPSDRATGFDFYLKLQGATPQFKALLNLVG
jgi:hypothetical protein